MYNINKCLKLFLETRLNKNFNTITEEDMKKIDSLVIEPEDNKYTLDLTFLANFKTVTRITIKNALIAPKDIDLLSSNQMISHIEFYHCTFVNEQEIKKLCNIISLSFYNCYIEDYSFLLYYCQLETFTIENPYDESDFDLAVLKNNVNMKKLVLDGISITGFYNIKELKQVCYLSLLGSVIEDEFTIKETLDTLTNLAELYISSNYLDDRFDNVPYNVRTTLITDATVEDFTKKM